MATVNVYPQYFTAEGTFNGVERHAASVMLIATSEEGRIKYEVGVPFFPHVSENNFDVPMMPISARCYSRHLA